MIYDVQKASLLKRFSAFLLDLILLVIVAVGFIYLMSSIVNLDYYQEQVLQTSEKYEELYGVDFDISAEDYEKLTEDEQRNYSTAMTALNNELNESGALLKYYSFLLMCLSVSLLLSFMLLEFLVPILLKNGQTVGMKVFNLGVVFTNSVRVTTFAMFVRSILGKFTIETMIPVLVVLMMSLGVLGATGVIVLLGIVVLQIVVFACTSDTRSFLHDLISNTVVVDMAVQMVFANADALIAYKENLAAEKAEKAMY